MMMMMMMSDDDDDDDEWWWVRSPIGTPETADNDFWESEVVYYIYTTTAVLTPAAGEKKFLVYKSKQIFL